MLRDRRRVVDANSSVVRQRAPTRSRAAALLAVGLAGCGGLDRSQTEQRIEAQCVATVDTRAGTRMLDVETDYLPRVIACENGAAAQGALMVQAVAARSYLYYRLARTGSIGDGTGDQVYTCARPPTAAHLRAAADTAGVVLRYPPDSEAVQVAAFFVAGALPDPTTCRGGGSDPTSTERYVTYNQGRSATEVVQTPLGLVNPTNLANRGCMSQNGSDCLAEQGRDYQDILRFYYGEDIAIVRATGPCVPEPVGPDGGVDVVPPGDNQLGGGCAAGGGAGLLALVVLGSVPWRLRRRRRRRRRL